MERRLRAVTWRVHPHCIRVHAGELTDTDRKRPAGVGRTGGTIHRDFRSVCRFDKPPDRTACPNLWPEAASLAHDWRAARCGIAHSVLAELCDLHVRTR